MDCYQVSILTSELSINRMFIYSTYATHNSLTQRPISIVLDQLDRLNLFCTSAANLLRPLISTLSAQLAY
jgi:hypothetical protein